MSTARSTTSTVSSMGPTPRTILTANEQESHEFYIKVLALEKELRVKESQLEQLSNDKQALERASKNKEVALLSLTNELMESKKHVSKLEIELSRKTEGSKALLEGERTNYQLNVDNAETLKSLEIEKINDGQIKLLPVDLYHHVMRLENELHDRNRVISSLEDENKTFTKLLKQQEEAFAKQTDELRAARTRLISTQDPVHYENRIRELGQAIVELQEENKMLLNIQKVKTDALEELTRELNIRVQTDQYVEQLKRELRMKDKQHAELREEADKFERQARYYEAAVDKYKQETVGVPYELWAEERRLLGSDRDRLQDACADKERIITGQKQRIAQLQESLNVVIKSCEVGQQPAKALRDLRRSKTNTSTSTSSLLSGSGLGLGSPSMSLDVSNISINDSTNTLPHAEDSVSIKLYELLEKNVQKMSASLQSKESSLAEKDEAIEILEKKIEVLSKARAADIKKNKNLELALKEDIKLLQARVEATVASSKEREGKLMTENNNLRRKVK